jgi:hypothetical protein
MLSFKTMFDAARAACVEARVGFRIGTESLVVTIADGTIDAERGDTEGADLVFIGAATAIAAIVYGGVPIEAMEAQGAVELTGDRALARRFVTLFPLPPKVEMAS